jgi:hypothetical protein
MNLQEVTALRVRMRRAFEADDIVTAEEVAMKLAPFEDTLCAELDRNPSAITPMWGLEA